MEKRRRISSGLIENYIGTLRYAVGKWIPESPPFACSTISYKDNRSSFGLKLGSERFVNEYVGHCAKSFVMRHNWFCFEPEFKWCGVTNLFVDCAI